MVRAPRCKFAAHGSRAADIPGWHPARSFLSETVIVHEYETMDPDGEIDAATFEMTRPSVAVTVSLGFPPREASR
eukprot:301785-Rhodomonas_salina.1